MELVNRFAVDASVEMAWKGLLDIPLVVDCLPGATLTETINATSYKGKIRVRLGPIVMEFTGALTLEISDDIQHVATINASWNETKNRGSATSVSRLTVTPTEGAGERTDVDVHTDVQLAGQVAQYGRGVGIIQAVGNELVRQFAQNLQTALSQLTQPKIEHQPASVNQPSAAASSRASTTNTPRESLAGKRAKEISTLPLLWAMFKARVCMLFAKL